MLFSFQLKKKKVGVLVTCKGCAEAQKVLCGCCAGLNRYGYQGEFSEEDPETGYNHFALREYDPVIGRWMVVDPYRQHWSPYMSMSNNPVMAIDPDGGFDWIKAGDGSYHWDSNVTSADNTPDGYTYVGASIKDVYADFNSTLSWFDFWSDANISFNDWPGEIAAFEPNFAGNLKEHINDLPGPASFVGNALYETADNAYVSFLQVGSNRHNLEGFGVNNNQVTDAGVNTMIAIIPYTKVARVNGLSASQFSSMFKGTAINKLLYRSGHTIRGWANKAYNYIYTRQIDYSIKAGAGGAGAINNMGGN